MKTKHYISKPANVLFGEINVPGDKSISHRALILGAIAKNKTTISGFLNGSDCFATLQAFQEMGVKIEISDDVIVIHGVGKYGLKSPLNKINCGNSGTTMRLLAGILSGQIFDSELIGDTSLMKRPMDRITKPLKKMGASITSNDGLAPLNIKGGNQLNGIDCEMEVPSAQVKSCLLLAGMYALGETSVCESVHSRDHTERMLTTFSYPILKSGNVLTINSLSECQGTDVKVPGDISSAAFFIVAASLVPDSKLYIKNVGINPGRIGILKILELMGASIEIVNKKLYGEEPVADLVIHSAKLEGIEIPQALVHIAIDEFPVIFIASACATGQTLLHGAKELRYKESDRIAVMVKGLCALGIDASELDDGIYIRGGILKGGVVDGCNDHRVTMAFAIAGCVSISPITIQNAGMVDTSFPDFIKTANQINMNISEF